MRLWLLWAFMLPFTADQIVKCCKVSATPGYTHLRSAYDYVTLLDVMCQEHTFDPSQEKAIRALTDTNLLLVQVCDTGCFMQ